MSIMGAKEGAITIGVQLAAIESVIARIQTSVMSAAIYHNPLQAETIPADVDRLDDMVTALALDVRKFRKALTS